MRTGTKCILFFYLTLAIYWSPAFQWHGTPVVHAQNEKVIGLTAEETTRAKGAWDALQAAQKDWEKAQEEIRAAHLRVPYGDPEAGSEILEGSYAGGLTGAIPYTSLYSNGSNGVYWSDLSQNVPPEKAKEDAERQKKYKAEEEKRRKAAKYERQGWRGFSFSSDFKFIVPKGITTFANSTPTCLLYSQTTNGTENRRPVYARTGMTEELDEAFAGMNWVEGGKEISKAFDKAGWMKYSKTVGMDWWADPQAPGGGYWLDSSTYPRNVRAYLKERKAANEF